MLFSHLSSIYFYEARFIPLGGEVSWLWFSPDKYSAGIMYK